MALCKHFDGLIGGVVRQQLNGPIEEIRFTWVEFGGVLILADGL